MYIQSTAKHGLSRRDFLKLSGTAGATPSQPLVKPMNLFWTKCANSLPMALTLAGPSIQ